MKLAALLLLILPFCSNGQVEFRFHGLKIFVSDISESKVFYTEDLGFEVTDTLKGMKILNQGFPIYIEKAGSATSDNYPKQSMTSLTVLVDHLLPTIEDLKSNSVYFFDTLLTRNGVGISIPFSDPSGNIINLMEVQVYDPGPLNQIRVYNTGITASNMDSARYFYQNLLGFEESSTDYLPYALPLMHRKDQTFAFMIHWKKGLKKAKKPYGTAPQMSISLEVDDLDGAWTYLTSLGLPVTKKENQLVCKDPDGNWVEIFVRKN